MESCPKIGFGAGEHLSGEAAANPDVDFIGCEPFINGVAALLADIDGLGLGNIRIFDDDVRLLLQRLPAASVSVIYILFPDPWPKARHNRRRIFQFETLEALSRIARDDALLLFASDHMIMSHGRSPKPGGIRTGHGPRARPPTGAHRPRIGFRRVTKPRQSARATCPRIWHFDVWRAPARFDVAPRVIA